MTRRFIPPELKPFLRPGLAHIHPEWRHGLVAAIPLWEGSGLRAQDVVSGVIGTFNGSGTDFHAWTVGPRGASVKAPTQNNARIDFGLPSTWEGIGTRGSIMAVATMPAIANGPNRKVFGRNLNPNSDPWEPFMLSVVGSNATNWEFDTASDTPGSLKQVPALSSAGQGSTDVVTGTYDGTTARLYVNGVQKGTLAQTVTIGTGAGAWVIGGRPDGGNESFDERVYVAYLWHTVLTPEQVQTLALDPYAPLRPYRRRYFAAVAAAIGTTVRLRGIGDRVSLVRKNF